MNYAINFVVYSSTTHARGTTLTADCETGSSGLMYNVTVSKSSIMLLMSKAHMLLTRYSTGWYLFIVALFIAIGGAHAADKPLIPLISDDPAPETDSERWAQLREQLFQKRSIDSQSGLLQLDAPRRAFDAARVPVTIRTTLPQNEDSYIRKLYLVVDKNPVPVAGTFTFEPNQGWDTIDAELRINEYSAIRVIAELNDESLHMSDSFVKAVGGCSAPPSSYDRSDATLLGSFNGGVEQPFNPKAPVLARIRLVHPNATGMQFDQFTRTYIPPHYIHTVAAEINGKPLFTLSTNFSLSQDPVLGFNFKPQEQGELLIYALDSKDRRFEKSWVLEPTDL